jgi:hypothetical protein
MIPEDHDDWSILLYLTSTFEMLWFYRAEGKICVYYESKWTLKEAALAYFKA